MDILTDTQRERRRCIPALECLRIHPHTYINDCAHTQTRGRGSTLRPCRERARERASLIVVPEAPSWPTSIPSIHADISKTNVLHMPTPTLTLQATSLPARCFLPPGRTITPETIPTSINMTCLGSLFVPGRWRHQTSTISTK